jgi:hypothetical protein
MGMRVKVLVTTGIVACQLLCHALRCPLARHSQTTDLAELPAPTDCCRLRVLQAPQCGFRLHLTDQGWRSNRNET